MMLFLLLKRTFETIGGPCTAVFVTREQRCIATGQWKVRGNAAAASARMSRSALGSAR